MNNNPYSKISNPYSVISKFDSIPLDSSRPLIICDIDETLLYIGDNNSQILQYPLFYNKHGYFSTSAIKNRDIFPTDIDGFFRLEQRVNSLGGKLMFLTARHRQASNYVVEDFAKIGLQSFKYDIHYTGNMISKGEYIKKFINVSGYNHLYFIDDLHENIESVYRYLPNAHLFLFSR